MYHKLHYMSSVRSVHTVYSPLRRTQRRGEYTVWAERTDLMYTACGTYCGSLMLWLLRAGYVYIFSNTVSSSCVQVAPNSG